MLYNNSDILQYSLTRHGGLVLGGEAFKLVGLCLVVLCEGMFRVAVEELGYVAVENLKPSRI